MTSKLLASFLLLSVTSWGQQDVHDCEITLNKTPYFIRHEITEPSDSLQNDIYILGTCGNFDYVDIGLLDGPPFSYILAYYPITDTIITYRSVLKSIDAFKKSENYPIYRKARIAFTTIENKLVPTEEPNKDKELLIEAGLSQPDLDEFILFIRSNTRQNWTYKEALVQYTIAKRNAPPALPEKIEFITLTDIESAIKTGKENGKKVLLYFSCQSCPHTKKFEDYIFNDLDINSLMTEKFIKFIAPADDKSIDTATNTTVGKKYMRLQAEYFKTNYQPYFCIIDDKGRVLSSVGFTYNRTEFLTFLRTGLQ